jgi:hypothetical protein
MYDAELDRFKSDISLLRYAIERHGYQRDRRKSSRSSHVLRHLASDDKIIVRRNPDGHWTYFYFRTLEVDDAFAVAVPGVRPHVQLLLELRTAGRIRIARSLFGYLVRTGRDPSALPDVFYTRVGAMLGGRLPGHKILPSLLSAYRPKPKRARARRGVPPRKAEAAKGKATPIDVVQGAAGGPRQARRRDA